MKSARIFGGRKVSEDQVRATATPDGTRTHRPIPHSLLLDNVVSALGRQGLEVVNSEYALTPGNLDGLSIPDGRFFGVLGLRSKSEPENDLYQLLACLRNAHDKQSAALFGLGMSIMVCTNMSFSADIKIGRKHTRFILRDLPQIINRALRAVPVLRQNQDIRIEAYRGLNLTDNAARVSIMRAAENDFISPSKTIKVWKEWKSPRHEAFAPRNAWSLFNGFTEVLKEYNAQDNPRRSMGLHSMFDEAASVQLATAN